MAYINTNWDKQSMWGPPYGQGYWGDSRIQIDPEISARWLEETRDPGFWLHAGPER